MKKLFENKTSTHIDATQFQNLGKSIKIEVLGIRTKLWYPESKHDSLNHFQFSEIKKFPSEKRYAESESRDYPVYPR